MYSLYLKEEVNMRYRRIEKYHPPLLVGEFKSRISAIDFITKTYNIEPSCIEAFQGGEDLCVLLDADLTLYYNVVRSENV